MPEKIKETIVVDETPVDEEPVAEAPVEEVTPVVDATVTTVKVQLDPEYSGPTPVYVSTDSPDFDRVELTSKPIEVPVENLAAWVALPYVSEVEA